MLTSLLFSLAFVWGCAVSEDPEQYILGGSTGNIANHPWQASFRSNGAHACGAVLIAGNKALTAAHCGGGPISAYSLLAGTSENTVVTCATCGLRDPITGFDRHPGFANNPSAGYPNDIAIISFYNIASNPNVMYATLAMASHGNFTGETCYVSGWGRTMAGGELPATLQEGMMTVITYETCIETWGTGRIDAGLQLCAEEPGVAVCGGDNGGPLVCNGIVAGLFSWGEANCDPTYPSVFVRISSYYDWIQENMSAEDEY